MNTLIREVTLSNWSTLKGNKIALCGSNFFPFKVYPFSAKIQEKKFAPHGIKFFPFRVDPFSAAT